MFLSEHF